METYRITSFISNMCSQSFQWSTSNF